MQILTKDSVTVSVDGVVYFRVYCPISAVANVTNAHSSTRLLAQTTLRNVLGTKNLAELLSDREGISLSMQVRIKCCYTYYKNFHLHLYISIPFKKGKKSLITDTFRAPSFPPAIQRTLFFLATRRMLEQVEATGFLTVEYKVFDLLFIKL